MTFWDALNLAWAVIPFVSLWLFVKQFKKSPKEQ